MNFFRIWPGGHKFPADHGGINIFSPKWKFVFIYFSRYYYFLFFVDLFVMKCDCGVYHSYLKNVNIMNCDRATFCIPRDYGLSLTV